jgi:hypothetical protein
MPLRRPVLVLMIVATALVGGHAAYWFHAAGLLRKGLDAQAAKIATDGGLAEWDRIQRYGYPFRIGLRFDQPRLATAGFSWQGDGAAVESSVFDPTRVTLSFVGRQHLSGRQGEGVIDSRSLVALLDVDAAGRLRSATIRGQAVRTAGLAAQTLTASVDALAQGAVDHQTPTLRLGLSVGDLDLPEDLPVLLGRRVAAVSAQAVVKGALPSGDPVRSLRAWADGGGVVEVSALSAQWAQLAVESEGTVALDPAGQPLASFTAKVRGLPDLMDVLAQSRLVEPGAANALRFVLLMMSKPDTQGRPTITVPVSLQDGAVYLGPARLARVPLIPWPKD